MSRISETLARAKKTIPGKFLDPKGPLGGTVMRRSSRFAAKAARKTVKKAEAQEIDKFVLYENAVQAPDYDAETMAGFYQEINGRKPRRLREDFCGTFQIACEWVKMHPENTAIALDLDEPTLAYGRENHWSRLTPGQRKRVSPMRKNVISVTEPKSDLIAACNFSYFIFKKRSELLAYFRAARASLAPNGLLCLDIVGGTEFETEGRETSSRHAKGVGKFTYVWELKSFDPINRNGNYAIHFKIPGRKLVKDAFTYDWRNWTIPEVRDVLAEAGFSSSSVFWEKEKRGQGTGEWYRAERAPNDLCWIAYIAAKR